MIFSKYNHLYISCNNYFLYNSNSNCLIKLDKEQFDFFKKVQREGVPPELDLISLNEFKNAKIIVEDDNIELNKIKIGTLGIRHNSDILNITILPTLDCNFKCEYCYEKNNLSKIYLNKEIEYKIFHFIKNNTQKKTHITWMGGEPLLGYNSIKRISSTLLKNNIKFTSQLISNGYLLSETKIKHLTKLKINSVQITVDGLKEEHDKSRVHITKSGTFNKIINNIQNLLKLAPQVHLNIRVNLRIGEEKKFYDLHSYLKEILPANSNLSLTPAFIENNKITCSFDRNSTTNFYINLYKKYGLKYDLYYPSNERIECSVRSPNDLIIGPSGEIYKCWENIGKREKIIGNINDKDFKNESEYFKYLTMADPLDDVNCNNCTLLPICSGGCPNKRIQNQVANKNHDCCIYFKDNLKDLIDVHNEIKQSIHF